MSDTQARETWANPGRGDIYILTYDPSGRELRSTPVRAGAKITLTIEERKINQDRAWSSKADIFTNGSLVPVRLVDTAEDYHEIASNPNLMSEDDMKGLFKLTGPKFKERLDEIDNPSVLNRMLEMADNADDEKLKVSMVQFKALQKRVADMRGDSSVGEVVQTPPGETRIAKFKTDKALTAEDFSS